MASNHDLEFEEYYMDGTPVTDHEALANGLVQMLLHSELFREKVLTLAQKFADERVQRELETANKQ